MLSSSGKQCIAAKTRMVTRRISGWFMRRIRVFSSGKLKVKLAMGGTRRAIATVSTGSCQSSPSFGTAGGPTRQAQLTCVLQCHQDIVERWEGHAVIEMIRQGQIHD